MGASDANGGPSGDRSALESSGDLVLSPWEIGSQVRSELEAQ